MHISLSKIKHSNIPIIVHMRMHTRMSTMLANFRGSSKHTVFDVPALSSIVYIRCRNQNVYISEDFGIQKCGKEELCNSSDKLRKEILQQLILSGKVNGNRPRGRALKNMDKRDQKDTHAPLGKQNDNPESRRRYAMAVAREVC